MLLSGAYAVRSYVLLCIAAVDSPSRPVSVECCPFSSGKFPKLGRVSTSGVFAQESGDHTFFPRTIGVDISSFQPDYRHVYVLDRGDL